MRARTAGAPTAPAQELVACRICLRRTWLIARLGANIEIAWRERRGVRDVLALPDDQLIAALAGQEAGRLAAEHAAFSPVAARADAAKARLSVVCRHDPRFPGTLRFTGGPVALHIAGDPGRVLGDAALPSVAIVGARRASPEGLEMARGLGRGLAAAGVTVVSGLALGIDSAAHSGALEVGGPTIAVLGGAADEPYPRSKAALHRALVSTQVVISELPPGFRAFRWSFPARNRIIAALGQMTVVVECAERSGSLITADFAIGFGRDVGAVPGRALSSATRGSNLLLRDGAAVVLGVEDILDAVVGSDRGRPVAPPALEPPLAALLESVAAGRSSVERLADTPEAARAARLGLAELELRGLVRRAPGGIWVAVVP